VGLSLSFFDNGVDQVETEFTAPDHFQGYPGILHGGIVAALLDEVSGRTVMIDDPNCFMMTAKLDIRYRQPVPLSVKLRITGTLIQKRRRIAKALAQIWLPDGTLAAEADTTLAGDPLYVMDGDLLKDLGWKIYPDGAS